MFRAFSSQPCTFGIVTAAVLAAGVLTPPAQACFCDCYYSRDCGILSWCVYTKCIRRHVGGKLKDGECSFLGLTFAQNDLSMARDALDLWLQAYEVAGGSGGGPPDAALVAQAQSLPLSSEQHEVVRVMAIAVQEAYLGLTSYSDPEPHLVGFFNPPLVGKGADCDNPYAPNDHGSVEPLDACYLGVGELIRQAIVGEIEAPSQGVFESFMAQIPDVCPEYVTYGRCEFPHPPKHGHEFPYPDGISCLTGELSGMVSSLLAAGGTVSASNNWASWGLVVIVATTACLAIRGRRASYTAT